MRFIGAIVLMVSMTAACAAPTAAPPEGEAPADVAAPTEVAAAPTEAPPEATEEEAPTSGVTFAGDVLPILLEDCSKCHGTGGKNPLVLDTYEGVMAGSDGELAVMAGDGAGSRLVEVIVSGEMPKGGEKLTDAEIQKISDWIDAGAAND